MKISVLVVLLVAFSGSAALSERSPLAYFSFVEDDLYSCEVPSAELSKPSTDDRVEDLLDNLELVSEKYLREFVRMEGLKGWTSSLSRISFHKATKDDQSRWFARADMNLMNPKGDVFVIKLLLSLDGKVFPLKKKEEGKAVPVEVGN